MHFEDTWLEPCAACGFVFCEDPKECGWIIEVEDQFRRLGNGEFDKARDDMGDFRND